MYIWWRWTGWHRGIGRASNDGPAVPEPGAEATEADRPSPVADSRRRGEGDHTGTARPRRWLVKRRSERLLSCPTACGSFAAAGSLPAGTAAAKGLGNARLAAEAIATAATAIPKPAAPAARVLRLLRYGVELVDICMRSCATWLRRDIACAWPRPTSALKASGGEPSRLLCIGWAIGAAAADLNAQRAPDAASNPAPVDLSYARA
eukprot:scaffold8760_cov116-Isochrysis_galbana.AAC.15